MSSQLDPGQIIKQAYDEANQAHQVNIVAGTLTEGATVADGGALPAVVKVVGGYDGTNVQVIKTDAAGELQIDVLSSALPTGASTEVKQDTGNTSLSSIDSKTPALGQALSAASVPVVLTAAQISTLTPLSSVTVTQATGTNLHAVIDSSALPTNASTSALQSTGNTSLSSIDGKLASLGQKTSAGSEPVVIASDQSAIPVSQSGTWHITNVSGTVSLPTGASTSANQTNKSQYARITDGTDDALVTVAGELNVLASAQPGIDIGDVTINNASGAAAVNIQDGGNSITVDATSLPLPTGASTSALQTTGNTSLSSIDSKIPALGQALAASSVPVVLTASQLTTLTPLTSVTVTQATGTNLHTVVDSSALPTGAATQATLSTLSTNVAARLTGSFVPTAFDETAITYVPSGNGVGQIQTAVYKLATVTVKTLTLSYDSSNRLSGVVAS